MNKENPKSITIITTTDNTDSKGAISFGPQFKKSISMDPDVFSKNLKSFLIVFNTIIEDETETTKKGFVIDEIELSLAVNASGGIELIGKADIGIEGGIKVKLKREGKNETE